MIGPNIYMLGYKTVFFENRLNPNFVLYTKLWSWFFNILLLSLNLIVICINITF